MGYNKKTINPVKTEPKYIITALEELGRKLKVGFRGIRASAKKHGVKTIFDDILEEVNKGGVTEILADKETMRTFKKGVINMSTIPDISTVTTVYGVPCRYSPDIKGYKIIREVHIFKRLEPKKVLKLTIEKGEAMEDIDD